MKYKSIEEFKQHLLEVYTKRKQMYMDLGMQEKADMCDKMIELAKKHNSKNSDSKDKLQKRKEYEAIAAQLQQLKEKKELEEKRRKEEKENQEKIKRERIVKLSKKGVGYITEEEARLIGKEKEWNDLIDSIIDNFPYCYIPAKDDYEFQKNPITPFALFNFMKKFNGRKK